MMSLRMVSVTHPPSSIPLLTRPRSHHKLLKLQNPQNPLSRSINSPCLSTSYRCTISHANTSPWEPSPVTYSPDDEETLPNNTTNIFETMNSSEPSTLTARKQQVGLGPINPPLIQPNHLKKLLWLLGPTLLLVTGVVPTLWLPIPSIFLGPNIASLLSLTGLDCIFNLGASLFLLMADSAACRPDTASEVPPSDYRFWNMAANVAGFLLPLMMLLIGSRRGFLEMPLISYAVLLGPYFLLLAVQMLTEVLMWHWRSPVWLVTPVVYEAYRLVQLMRGLRLGAEMGTPGWTVHMVRGLVCGWVVVLGVQLMRVAWYAGFTARQQQPPPDASADGY